MLYVEKPEYVKAICASHFSYCGSHFSEENAHLANEQLSCTAVCFSHLKLRLFTLFIKFQKIATMIMNTKALQHVEVKKRVFICSGSQGIERIER